MDALNTVGGPLRLVRIMGTVLVAASLLFLVVGAGRDLYRWWRVRSWVGVEGVLHKVWLERSVDSQPSSSDPRLRVRHTSFLPMAEYEYEFGGRSYRGSEVTTGDVADNLEDSQRLVLRLQEQRLADPRITVWVDPTDPERSVLVRGLRWKPVLARGGLAVALLLVGLLMLRLGGGGATAVR